MENLKKYFSEVKEEFYKIDWPKNEDSLKNTINVVTFCFVLAVFVGFIDFSFIYLLGYYFNS